jgi:hypothetical protein
MLIMHKGYQLVPVKGGDRWQAQVFSGGKLMATTMLLVSEDAAMAEARAIVDGLRSGRRQSLSVARA